MLLQIPLGRLPSVTRATLTEPFHRMSSRLSMSHGHGSRLSSFSHGVRSSFSSSNRGSISAEKGSLVRQMSVSRGQENVKTDHEDDEKKDDEEDDVKNDDFSEFSSSSRKQRKSSFFAHASEFLRHPGEAIRKTRLPTFHAFHKLEEHEVKEIPLKHRLTFKFAKTAKSQSSVTSFHFQERMSLIQANNNTVHSASEDLEIGNRTPTKEENVRAAKEVPTAAPPILISHRNTNSLRSIHRTSSVRSNNHTAVTSEPADLSQSEEGNPEPSWFSSCYSVITRFTSRLYSSLPKVTPLTSSSTAHTPITYATASTKNHLENFKSSAEHVGHEFHSIFLFKKPVYYQRAVELTIFFNCLYMSLWATNMITIVNTAGYSSSWETLVHVFM